MYVHVMIVKKVVMNLKENKEKCMGGFWRREGNGECCNYTIISTNKKNKRTLTSVI